MRIRKFGAGLFLVAALLVTNCFAHVFAVIQYSHNKNEPGARLPSIDLWADDHFGGTKEDNINQLRQFIQTLTKLGRVHLVIESKFFYQINCLATNDLDAILAGPGYAQRDDVPTWIAWDLPRVLISIFNDLLLPNYINIEEYQINYIRNNITVDFIDPRLKLEDPSTNLTKSLEIELQVQEEFSQTNQHSPKKTRDALSSYVSSRISNMSEESRGPSSHDYLLDVEALGSIIKSLYTQEQPVNKIIVLCGAWHVYHLDRIMPSFGLTTRKEFKLKAPPPNQSSVARKHEF